MTDATASAPAASEKTAGGAFYRLVWKWHFLASLYVLPFMAMLAVTGGIYLYKPHIEEVIYADRLNVAVGPERQSYEAQLAALSKVADVTRIRGIETEDAPGRATLVTYDDADKIRTYAWIDPYTTEVLATQPRDETAMRVLRKFHGELLLGDFGTKFVELAAHWAIVMFVTGIYLWWPRGQRTVKKAFTPPAGRGRSFWRETHLFTGFLAAVLVLPIIFAGLPWTDVWGGGLGMIQERTGTTTKSLRFGGDVPGSTTADGTPISYDAVFAVAKAQGLVPPYETRPPRDAAAAYWVRSASVNRAEQTELIVDQYSGAVLKRHDFADNPALARVVSQGISFHQGELYGWLNLAQNTLAVILTLILSVSGFVAWWMRRPAGSLGVPAAPQASLGIGMIVLVIGLGILFPLVGASLIVALCLDWLIFRRLGWFQGHQAN
ncbi:PepSY domain-containing protein [Yoonia sp. SS1-5]|uniref:PepSY-associated TM helix domain-containing protein n=1 Tax=Yoonia rhodophyticola TaxID=3137370 RepID=A0AAN0M9X5_9RHOB